MLVQWGRTRLCGRLFSPRVVAALPMGSEAHRYGPPFLAKRVLAQHRGLPQSVNAADKVADECDGVKQSWMETFSGHAQNELRKPEHSGQTRHSVIFTSNFPFFPAMTEKSYNGREVLVSFGLKKSSR